MKVVIQKVKYASCKVNGEITGSIDRGYMILLGVCEGDDQRVIDRMAKKVVDLRIFEDSEGKMNLDIRQAGGDILSIPQFTLYANCRKGKRPSFVKAARPEISKPVYEKFNQALAELGMKVETGIFGADMKVELLNDGPCTIVMDSDEIC